MAKVDHIGATGKITMNGGRGGNTYGPADQVVFDPNPMNSNDEYVTGVVNENAAGTGQGGGGGGGSGGAILLEVRDSLTIAAGAVLQCAGGAAGTTGSGKNGGVGGSGRIGFMGFALTTEAAAATLSVAGGATITPAAGHLGRVLEADRRHDQPGRLEVDRPGDRDGHLLDAVLDGQLRSADRPGPHPGSAPDERLQRDRGVPGRRLAPPELDEPDLGDAG